MIKYTITRDFCGWCVSISDNETNTENVVMGLHSKDDAEKYIKDAINKKQS